MADWYAWRQILHEAKSSTWNQPSYRDVKYHECSKEEVGAAIIALVEQYTAHTKWTRTQRIGWLAKNYGIFIRSHCLQRRLRGKKVEMELGSDMSAILDEMVEREEQIGAMTNRDREKWFKERTGKSLKGYDLSQLVNERLKEKGLSTADGIFIVENSDAGNSSADHSSSDGSPADDSGSDDLLHSSGGRPAKDTGTHTVSLPDVATIASQSRSSNDGSNNRSPASPGAHQVRLNSYNLAAAAPSTSQPTPVVSPSTGRLLAANEFKEPGPSILTTNPSMIEVDCSSGREKDNAEDPGPSELHSAALPTAPTARNARPQRAPRFGQDISVVSDSEDTAEDRNQQSQPTGQSLKQHNDVGTTGGVHPQEAPDTQYGPCSSYSSALVHNGITANGCHSDSSVFA